MYRLSLLAVAVCLPGNFLHRAVLADEPAETVVAVSDWRAASLLRSFSFNTTATDVLVQNDGDDYQTANSREIAMRRATHVVYLGGDESLLSRMFRERLMMQGARPIDLRTVQRAHQHGRQRVDHHRALSSNHLSLAVLLNQP
ncbi:hypothetical protein Enr13x_57550 [Stieleria neptunia]|uniref:Uncharacterized protein n=1 Tax=Stieleria neptunia TaxID=2527979 RepID=A0A518HYC2_9BACT|nr:hypothetical protein [Stieleria neptunia]QDV45852.1 hypothetical protein Enr13x_57550 [Stieleria neptunia]